jgi:hypothetical protein
MSLASMLLLAAASAANEAPICTDRPTKANAICTVPKGSFQLETSVLGWTLTKAGGTKTKALSAGSSFLKYGLTDRSDLQLGFTPYVRIRNSGPTDDQSGVGDITVRYKHRLSTGESPVQVDLLPFVKIPTAKHGIGNRKLEGGLAVPISFGLGGGVTATLGPELDLIADGDGHGRHLALVNLVNLSAPIVPRLTLIGELWSNLNFDPADTIKQASADAAVAYALSPSTQLDMGVNAGLTPDTADVEVYAGVSLRF